MLMLGLNESIFWQNSQHLAPGTVGAMHGIDCTILRQKLELFNVHIKIHFKTCKKLIWWYNRFFLKEMLD